MLILSNSPTKHMFGLLLSLAAHWWRAQAKERNGKKRIVASPYLLTNSWWETQTVCQARTSSQIADKQTALPWLSSHLFRTKSTHSWLVMTFLHKRKHTQPRHSTASALKEHHHPATINTTVQRQILQVINVCKFHNIMKNVSFGHRETFAIKTPSQSAWSPCTRPHQLCTLCDPGTMQYTSQPCSCAHSLQTGKEREAATASHKLCTNCLALWINLIWEFKKCKIEMSKSQN